MKENNPIIEVYGTEVICASCVNAPSSKDTYEWLQAAISRKYPKDSFSIRYIDIEQPLENEVDKEWAERIQNDEFFYPLVLINGNVVGEGYIQIQPIFSTLEKHGFSAAE
ncbi:YuzD family protein [Ureibacillus sinduriensis]|uniref:Disulfide oxidoreductase n=1 Tax=Ureibacillus sinduriensis BLB-1 = JCM 15800 TaxID=1384057 RepID=A0A0A3IJK8_9BACL|nr:YuzD family protein [Ureibacillus sinduriensis]KGR75062.1 disulfide oxidoreductase [Ureibacillus sinduriensis BLB-1 = JCM 15800]